MTQTLSPVAVFAYNRPASLHMCLSALAYNEGVGQSHVYVFCDGPKDGATEKDMRMIQLTRKVAHDFPLVNKTVIEKEANLGLAQSIISGVSDIVSKHGRVIVLEDDLETSPFFLSFMNDALKEYERDNNVLAIGACNFFAQGQSYPETFFLPIPDCWGWATWKDRWDLFNSNSEELLDELKQRNLFESFDLYGKYPFTDLLKDHIAGKVSSWAIRWQASAYIHNKLTLYPGFGLTKHRHSSNGTHAGEYDNSNEVIFPNAPIHVEKRPVIVEPKIYQLMADAYFRLKSPETGSRPVPGTLSRAVAFGKRKVRRLKNRVLLRAQGSPSKSSPPIFSGNYPTWKTAMSECGGYDSNEILQRCLSAILSVKTGAAAYERDSVLFDEIQYSWPLLAALLKAGLDDSFLSVLDFGGSLGSSYFQNREFLTDIPDLRWSIVEQPHFVEAGNKYVSDGVLRFYHDVQHCVRERAPNVLIASSVIQYLEHPFKLIDDLIKTRVKYLIVDRTAFSNAGREILTIQNVPEEIYPASYPAWFFDERAFLSPFLKNYNLITKFDSGFTDPVELNGLYKGHWGGFILKLKQ